MKWSAIEDNNALGRESLNSVVVAQESPKWSAIEDNSASDRESLNSAEEAQKSPKRLQGEEQQSSPSQGQEEGSPRNFKKSYGPARGGDRATCAQVVSCRYWAQGDCRLGRKCTFRHELNSAGLPLRTGM